MEIKDAAAEKLKSLIKASGRAGVMRVFVTQGCCGPALDMDLVEAPGQDDLEVANKDFKVYVEKAAIPLVEKAVLDCNEEGDVVMSNLAKPEGNCSDGCNCGH